MCICFLICDVNLHLNKLTERLSICSQYFLIYDNFVIPFGLDLKSKRWMG